MYVRNGSKDAVINHGKLCNPLLLLTSRCCRLAETINDANKGGCFLFPLNHISGN